MVATCKNPDIPALYERLLVADKTKMCALGAAMRKLVHICYGVVKNQTPYQAQSAQPYQNVGEQPEQHSQTVTDVIAQVAA